MGAHHFDTDWGGPVELHGRFDEDDRAVPSGDGFRYLQRIDGSWSLVGDDGWEIDPADLHPDVRAALAAVTFAPIDIDPLWVVDTEIR
ncbi:Uncharacterised protein [Nocardia otitidiscaviarum]|uniref:Uncharacterized protein n=1 Tax=Nocardia otitidiscaviarum TaxID=1823 RepID=A0A378YEH4_9NOCA|nr:hypothetical protein [Nocardia otitidiscaviarum]MBF6237969.1 hypothetical protein [Nocardia otitidiscaviarum]SUA74789.1 Uncharacterised protein [Nocardia otitidiscaviarum]